MNPVNSKETGLKKTFEGNFEKRKIKAKVILEILIGNFV